MSLALASSTYMYLTFPNDMEAWNFKQKPPTAPSPVHLRTRTLVEKKILHQCLLMLLVKHRMTKKDTHHDVCRGAGGHIHVKRGMTASWKEKQSELISIERYETTLHDEGPHPHHRSGDRTEMSDGHCHISDALLSKGVFSEALQ